MKNLLNLGKVLNRQEQKQINGGGIPPCTLAPPGVPCYGGKGGVCVGFNDVEYVTPCSEKCTDGSTPFGCRPI